MAYFWKAGFVFFFGSGENEYLSGGGGKGEKNKIPVYPKPLRFLFLPSLALLPALGPQGITTAREVIGEKKIQSLQNLTEKDQSVKTSLLLNKTQNRAGNQCFFKHISETQN